MCSTTRLGGCEASRKRWASRLEYSQTTACGGWERCSCAEAGGEAGYRLRTLAGHTSAVFALAGLPGGLLASGSLDNTVRVWEVESGRLVRTLAGHTDFVRALSGLPGGLMASGSDDMTIAVWRIADAIIQ